MRWTPLALLALVAFALAFPVVATLSGPNPYHGLGSMHALPQPLSLAIVFVTAVRLHAEINQPNTSGHPQRRHERPRLMTDPSLRYRELPGIWASRRIAVTNEMTEVNFEPASRNVK